MRRLVASLPLALLLAACQPSPPAPSATTPETKTAEGSAPETAKAAPNLALGTEPWFAWVDQTLGISDGEGHGPDPGSDEWNMAVQTKLGEEAPQSQPGSPQWQQSVDSLLRTRAPKSP